MSSIFDKVVFDWLRKSLDLVIPGYPDFSGTPVIREEQNGPRPKVEYLSYKVLDWTESDFDGFDKSDIDGDDDNLAVDYYNRNRVTVSVNAYSENGREMLSRVSKSKKKWEVRRELLNDKVSHIRTGTIRDLTFLGDTRFRRRFQVDYTFLVWVDYLEIRPRVKEIELTGTTHK